MVLGRGGNAATVVIIGELVGAIDSVALVMSTKKKWLKIVHIVLTVFWIVLALLNIFL